MPQDRAALGYAAFAGAMAVMRFLADALRARYSERQLLRASGAVTAVSMSMELCSMSMKSQSKSQLWAICAMSTVRAWRRPMPSASSPCCKRALAWLAMTFMGVIS